MRQTRNDLPSNTKAVAIELLTERLADTIDLALLTKQAHWNLKGPQFIAIHEMLDGFRTQIDGYADTMPSVLSSSAAPRSALRRRWQHARRSRRIRPTSTPSRTIWRR
jgi:DNA-binding ferritin-like protein